MMFRKITVSLLPFALLFASSCATPKPYEKPIIVDSVPGGAGSLAAARKYLEGRWALESFEVTPPGKPTITLKGAGSLVFDEFSNLKIDIRTTQAEADLLRAGGIEIGNDGTISSDGRAAVDMQNRTLTYNIQGQPPPGGGGPLAMSRPRYWVVEQNLLTLTTKNDAGAVVSTGRWRKAN